MHICTYLFLMAAGILVPVIVFSGLALGMLQDAERSAALRGLKETANGIALLVDRELYTSEAALKVLVASPSLARGDFQAFYQEVKITNRGDTGWSVLMAQGGQQLINTSVLFGTPLPRLPDAYVDQVLAAQATMVSPVRRGALSGRLLATVNVPVVLGPTRRYVLAQSFSTEHFQRLIASAPVPRGWLLAIIDSNGNFVARNLNQHLVGSQAKSELVAAIGGAHSGQLRHRTLEGVESFDVFTHSALSGWAIAVAAPVSLIERSARRASLVAGLGLAAAMLCGALLAVFFGRLHVRSIWRAVKAATDLGQGIAPQQMVSRVSEVNALHAALHAAGEQMLQAQAYRKHAEAERQALLEGEQTARLMAEQQNSAKDQFLAMLGHELRNPLAPISTAAQLLKLQSGDPNRVRYASDVIVRQVAHMNSLLGDMLDVSRVTRGLVALNIEPVDLKALIERAVEQTHSLIEVRHHRLSITVPEQRLQVQGDPTRLIQIVVNLLNNAAKYTAPHGTISVLVQVQDDQVCIAVQDSGEGIPAELLPRIFELFSQGERKPDRAQGGLGLGLALVRSLVQLHGGTVSAASDGPGLGSTFTICLPHDANGAPALAADTPEPARRHRLRLMLVDDNIDGAISLSLLLKQAGGHQVCTYYDAAGALEWAVSEAPQVFILDIGLPDITGYELARRLRMLPQFAQAVFIALTGYGQAQDRERARAAGFDHHLAKPADPQQILDLLDQIGAQVQA